MHTTAFWLHFPAEFLARFSAYTPAEKQSGISGLGNALRTVAALLLMCDPRDLGVALSEDISGGLETFEPNLYLYDMYPGGVGQSAPLDRLAPQLLKKTAELLHRITSNRSVLVIEHDMGFVEDIAHKVTVLDRGKVISEGSMAHVKSDPRVVEVYLGH